MPRRASGTRDLKKYRKWCNSLRKRSVSQTSKGKENDAPQRVSNKEHLLQKEDNGCDGDLDSDIPFLSDGMPSSKPGPSVSGRGQKRLTERNNQSDVNILPPPAKRVRSNTDEIASSDGVPQVMDIEKFTPGKFNYEWYNSYLACKIYTFMCSVKTEERVNIFDLERFGTWSPTRYDPSSSTPMGFYEYCYPDKQDGSSDTDTDTDTETENNADKTADTIVMEGLDTTPESTDAEVDMVDMNVDEPTSPDLVHGVRDSEVYEQTPAKWNWPCCIL